MIKKITAAIMTLVLFFALASNALTAGAAAAATSFPDVTDQKMAREVAVLQMLGVIGGDERGNFNPNGTLTRASFCKMAVITMGRGDEVPLYKSRTIFTDVRADHWARGYINVAVSGEKKIIAGSGGYFMPDQNITYAQAVTVLMRMLGYTDADASMMWPDGYMSLAADIELTEGMGAAPWDAPLSRAQAAHLFCNLLGATVKGGSSTYISTLGTASSGVVVMQLGVQAADGTGGAIRTSEEVVKTVNGIVPPSILGTRGTILKDKVSGKVLTFLPEEHMLTITTSQISASWIKDANGVRYDIPTTATTYTTSEKDTYGKMFINIAIGGKVTFFYSAGGKIDGVFINASSSDSAIVVGASTSNSDFGYLTGGDTGYKVLKNGAPATLSDIRQNDVVTYDRSAKILNVSDFRLTGCYEDCWPNMSSPSEIKLMGQKFPVLPSAIDSLAGFKVGQIVTFLFTSDLQVAGAATAIPGSNAVGIVQSGITGSSVTVRLLNGLTLKGDPNMTDTTAAEYAGELVMVASSKPGQLSIAKFGSSGASGDLDLVKQTLGTVALSPAVKVFERVGTGSVAQIALADIVQTKISVSKVLYAHTDYAGRIDMLILNDVTGDRYTYGLVKQVDDIPGGTWPVWNPITSEYDYVPVYNNGVTVINSGNEKGTVPVATGQTFTNGSLCGVAFSADGKRINAIVTLTEVKNVSRSSFYVVNGQTYVHLANMDMLVSADVECYNKLNNSWFDTLNDARAFADTLTLYYDRAPSDGGKIRMVIAG